MPPSVARRAGTVVGFDELNCRQERDVRCKEVRPNAGAGDREDRAIASMWTTWFGRMRNIFDGGGCQHTSAGDEKTDLDGRGNFGGAGELRVIPDFP